MALGNLNGNWWKYGLAIGGGVALGAIGAVLISRGTIDLKKAAATVLSHGLDLKDKAAATVETAKENIEDLAAEARTISDERDSKNA